LPGLLADLSKTYRQREYEVHLGNNLIFINCQTSKHFIFAGNIQKLKEIKRRRILENSLFEK
jgi:hypothetical protein